jgi:hypothetical protein
MRFHRWSVGVALGPLLLSAAALPVTAQADSGARIRVSTNTGMERRWFGTFVSLDADSLRFWRRGSLVSLPLSSVERVERSLDRRTNAGGGAVIGALVGGGTGLLLGLLASGEDNGFYDVDSGDVLTGTLMLGAIGGGLGALIGAASHKERWEPIAVGQRIGLVLHL